ncbi:GDSL esterase/lipase At1g29670-like [Apium graveolens]|uniref:GDSL esterase/lipase At1g29670-like n=1 Tax=Apium graveolens TaxID=4045 RepID=UPI003D79FE31
MALELNMKKYLVLCVMVILLNHHINGAKGAEPQDPKKGSKTDEPHAPASGSKADKAPDDNRPESKPQASAAEASQSGPKIPAQQIPKYASQGGPENIRTTAADQPQAPNNTIIGHNTKARQSTVPCYFIFGDSLVDAGNNNILKTLARADYDPYGIDFKAGATGRFSNGKTTVDFIAELLGFSHYIPPSERTNGTDMLQGLNFASAAAGIREETAQHLGDRITMREQVDNFKYKVGELAGLLGGPENTTDYLGKCLFQIGLGSNDYLNNYFVPSIYPTSKLLTPEQYADDLIKQYTAHLMDIYNLGARKFALTGVSQVGCSPNSLAQGSPDGNCVKNINDANELFNNRLKILVDTLNRDHPDAKFTYINSFGLFQELKDKAATYGFKVTNEGCCGIGKYRGQITCLPGISTCTNRNEYLFWDAYHPTEATNRIGAKRSYTKEIPSDAYPFDIQTLVTLK